MRPLFLMIGLAAFGSGCGVSQAEYNKAVTNAGFEKAELGRAQAEIMMTQAMLTETRRIIAELAEQKSPEGFCEEENLALRGSLEVARASYLAKFDDITICRYYGTGDHETLPVITKMYGGDYVDCSLYTPTTSDGYEISETNFEIDHSVETGKSTLVAPYETD